MARRGKNYKKALEKLGERQVYTLQEGLQKVKELAFAKFDETITASVNLGIDPTKGDQVVRGSVVLPHAVGAQKRVLVFAKGEYADQAKNAGADYVGAADLIDKIAGGWMDFDVAVATPDMMADLAKVARVLGPRGLLPNKKLGTVTFDVSDVVKDLKKGLLFFKNDKSGLVHFAFAKKSQDVSVMQDNAIAFLKALASSKPATSKGRFLKKITLSSTMGPGVQVNVGEIL